MVNEIFINVVSMEFISGESISDLLRGKYKFRTGFENSQQS